MVQYSTSVDRAFAALGDPTRRAVLERLGAGSATQKVGRVRRCMLAPYAFEGISTWLQRLDRFAQVVERTRGAP
jgi:DNA-binding transcriptional ArsR family regulator